jgi:hypothetical protein
VGPAVLLSLTFSVLYSTKVEGFLVSLSCPNPFRMGQLSCVTGVPGMRSRWSDMLYAWDAGALEAVAGAWKRSAGPALYDTCITRPLAPGALRHGSQANSQGRARTEERSHSACRRARRSRSTVARHAKRKGGNADLAAFLSASVREEPFWLKARDGGLFGYESYRLLRCTSAWYPQRVGGGIPLYRPIPRAQARSRPAARGRLARAA